MNDEISAGGPLHQQSSTDRRMHQMQIGDALVWVEHVGAIASIETGDEVYAAAALPNAQEIFPQAVHALRECVRVVGDQVQDLGAAIRPQEIQIEFSLSFEATSEGGFIPVFRAGAGVTTGLKVTATWELPTAESQAKD